MTSPTLQGSVAKGVAFRHHHCSAQLSSPHPRDWGRAGPGPQELCRLILSLQVRPPPPASPRRASRGSESPRLCVTATGPATCKLTLSQPGPPARARPLAGRPKW